MAIMDRDEMMRNAALALEAAKTAAALVVTADELLKEIFEQSSETPASDKLIDVLYEGAEKSGELLASSVKLAVDGAVRCEQRMLSGTPSREGNTVELHDAERGLYNARMYLQRIQIALGMAKGVSDTKEE